ncbi:M14 family zinc carboxypeptidase [Flavisolibacter ginsenosidimutans]|uniref:T9SS type A sorting domain-containing protein n=1 Tax=Flavisolibacter ginsenosidimutans TaxID=661481 RepID=A0A5B8UEV8_9BACT|nr:M14 family zinc carboxypeptidase [Flavisolibacter ginsenosidimutans]QEC55013.1 T9SS type A sorting domain-containing protein [Flavisolibacter ginsenosidimutans]
MKLFRVVSILCACLALNPAYSQPKTKYSQVKIFVPKKEVSLLQKAGVGIDHAYYNASGETMITTLNAAEIQKLAASGIRYETTIEDEEADFIRRNKPDEFFKNDNSQNNTNAAQRLLFSTADKSFASTVVTPAAFNSGSMGGYLTFAQMKKELDSMVLNYPALAKLDSIGHTYENRAIWALTISDNVNTNENEPEVLFTGMHHAREPLGMENLIFFMQYLLENYATNDRIKEIVDNRQLVFIPCLNPDGYVYNQTTNPAGGGLWRKNRQPNSDGSFGQDLNRNYGYGFDYPNNGSSDVTTDDNYHGDYAFQAMETQLMRDYLKLHNFQFAVNYHAYGGYWIHGYCVPTGTLSGTDSAIIKTTGAMGTRYDFYEVGTPPETVGYTANGSSDDWFMAGDLNLRSPVYAVSPEVGLGLNTFWPASSNIITYCKDVFFGNLQAALFGGAYVDVDDKTTIALTSKTGTLDFLLRRIGRVDSSVKVTVIPLENLSSVGAPATVSSLPNYLGTATVSINYTMYSNIANGQRIKFVVKTETGGITKLDTLVKFYNPTVILSDDMEGSSLSTSWASSSWGYTSASAFNGTHSLSQSPGTTYGNNVTSTITTASALDLSNATAAYLTFWTRYRSQNGYDKLQIQYTTGTKGNATYTPLSGVHTVMESKGTLGGNPALTGYQDYWVKETVDLKNVLSSATVKLRFEFTSDASGTDEGFFLDDIQVIKSTVPLVILPVNFTDVRATKAGNQVAIKWEASTGPDHLYFEVERATDGISFMPVFKTVEKGETHYATDASPVRGANFYRIKAVSLGGVQYSKTVQVIYANESNVTLYPNPVNESLQLKLNGLASGRYQIQIVTLSGQVAGYHEFSTSNASQELKLNTSGLRAGAYYLYIRNGNGTLIDVKNFSKL